MAEINDEKEDTQAQVETKWKLFECDSLDSERGFGQIIPSGSIDLILTDPPYGVTARNDWDHPVSLDKLFESIQKVLKPNGVVVFFSQGMLTAQLMMGPWKKFWRYNLIWVKNKPRGFLNARRCPLRYHEDLVVFYQKQPTYHPQMIQTSHPVHACKRKRTSINYQDAAGGENQRAGQTDRFPGSCLHFPVINAEDSDAGLHPTQKPVALCEWIIRSFSNEGDTVLDPFSGSASTGVAALSNRRNFIGFEKDSKFCAVARGRLNNSVHPVDDSTQFEKNK